MNNDIIQHYGVKGMKWGIRKEYISNAIDKVKGMKLNVNKQDVSNILDKIKSGAKKVKEAPKNLYNDHVENIRFKYKQKGYSPEEVERRTQRRLKMEKVAVATAATVAVAYTGYILKNRIENEFTGSILKKGTKIDTVTDVDKLDLSKRFYGSPDVFDKLRYQGMYAKQRTLNSMGMAKNNVVTARVNKDIRVAPQKEAKRVFDKLYNNDTEFRNTYERILNSGRWNPLIDNKIKNDYEMFNVAAVDRNSDAVKLQNKFFDSMRKRGYGAMVDINDSRYSGFGSNKPVIMFNNSEGVLSNAGSRALSDLEVNAKNAGLAGLNTMTDPTTYALAGSGAYVANRINTARRKRLENR